eukprot:m.285322 g.285322  ORF g.285322 m.285322 type:complete len:60 (-) comp15775_c1_seq2:4267-4446(-)
MEEGESLQQQLVTASEHPMLLMIHWLVVLNPSNPKSNFIQSKWVYEAKSQTVKCCVLLE